MKTSRKTRLNVSSVDSREYFVLDYEQLLKVNGGGLWTSIKKALSGSSSSNSTNTSSTTNNTTNRGYPSSTEGYSNCIKGEAAKTDVIATYEKNGTNTMYVSEITKDKNGNVVDVKYTEYNATNNVQTPEQRGDPVSYNGYNYYPTQFPDGSWTMEKSHESSDPYVGPVSISTNANQNVTTYKQNTDNTYYADGTVNDTGYSIHSGTGNTTWGCIKMSDADVSSLANSVNSAIDSGGSAKLIVY